MKIETKEISFAEYHKMAQRTASTTTARDKLINGALGLCGEVDEYARERLFVENRVKEAGDVMWYVAELAEGLGVTIADIAAIEDDGSADIYHNAAVIADAVKKYAFQGHKIEKYDIMHGLNWIMSSIAQRMEIFGYSIDDILRGNVEKLLKRYPDGFEAERSIHR